MSKQSQGGTHRREDIIAAARELYETKGHSRTTIRDITDYLGVTRSLYYHYFSDKEAVTDEVLNDYVNDFIEALQYWNAQRERGEVEKALEDILHILRSAIFENDSFRRDLASTENSALYMRFVHRVADRIARYIVDSTVPEYAQYHDIKIEYIYETFFVLIVGLIALIKANPDIGSEVIKGVAAQALHLDLKSSKD
jgi:AcrR family transcriptional regulator